MLKNLKEKFKKGFSKKKIVSIAIFAVAVIATIIAIVVNQISEQSSKKKVVADGELARAMTYDQFVDGDEAVDGTDNVKFSAFFLRDVNNDGYAEKIKGTCKQIGKEDTLYMEVNVRTDGILKNAKIEIDGKNFYLATTAPKDNELKDNYVGINTKKLEFNDLANGTQKLITGFVRSGDYTYSSSKTKAIGSNINNLSRNDNKIIFTGTYVGSDENEIEINKEITLQTDWYGTTSASISTSNSTYYDIQDRQDEENGTLTLTAGIRVSENDYQLNLKKNYIEGIIPQLNGYDPISVTSESSTDSFDYDETTRKFTLTREATVDENGNIVKSISRDNYYTLKIIYPLEAYKSLGTSTVTISIPVMTYYEGYNNQNTEFTNPYKSNEAKSTLIYTYREEVPQEVPARIDIKTGDYVASPTYRYVVSKKKPLKIYNGISSEENDDIYNVEWYVTKGTKSTSDGLILKERKDGEDIVSDVFVNSDASIESMENLTANIGIGFNNANNFLAEDGFIKVYDDETDELLVTFTKDDWGKYTKISPYKFSMPVKHIRVETSETEVAQYLYVYSQKQLDDEYITTNYTREQFDNLKYIKSNLNVYAGEKLLGTVTHSANYEAPFSIASLSVSNNTLSTQLTEKNEILTIKATANESANQVGWTNGSFLIKLPTDIITADINNVEINNSNVNLASYEYIENDNGKFIKVNTQNTSNTAQTFEIKLDTNITPDPRIATTTENFELWASNEEGADYYYGTADIYDVNDNLNTAELVHKSTATISLIAPNSLLTNQTASGFDKSGAQVVSPQIADVKPQLATVSQDTPEKTVRIGAQIKNNYSSVITDVVMLGKIPFEGNTYVLGGEDLGSEFTTKMTEAGIEVPEALKDKVVVYYSENETPDKDLTKESNGWKTAENITNWDNVKTFLIDFKDTEVASGAEYTFYYTIKVPNGLDYNKKAFSHHGVYFALKTDEGKYKTQTEPNKLGLRIAEKYNLELQKYQTGKTNLVPGATYKITKEATDTEDEESKTAVTNAEGKLELQNLYAKRTYSIEEIKTPEDYELNTDVIKIIGTIQEDGSLQVEKTQGTTKEDIEITKAGEDEPYKVTIKVEDEAKAKLKITKLEKGTTTLVRGIKYKLTGEGLPESGKNVTTNANGEIIVKGLKVGEEYTLEEVKADGYYLATEPIKFTITNTDGTYEINVSEGTVKESTITEEENIPTANIQVEDEKIPTYNLEISKIQRITSTALTEDELKAKAEQALSSTDTVYLAGAKFRLYKGTKEIGTYVTDENGKIILNDLYQYIDGKDEEAIYTLKETLSPEGYSKVQDITFKVDGTSGELKFINTEGKSESYTVENNILKLLVEDNPSFKLIKKDAETSELLANIKFAIYNIDNDTMAPAKNSKGEIIGIKETINGKEYYTVTTDSKGEITADLPEGMYKAVEVEAPEKYDLSDSTYYFGIGTSREGKIGCKATWAKGIGGTSGDYINSAVETNDGGYIVGGDFQSSSIDLGNGISLISKGSNDGMVIKYGSSGEVEWAKGIGGEEHDEIQSVAVTSDGGYIVGGYFESSSIDLGNGISLANAKSGSPDGMVIKYGSSGEVEWAKEIAGTKFEYVKSVAETSDGSYIVVGNFSSQSIDLGNGVSLANAKSGYSDGMVIKYRSRGEVEWAKGIGGTSSDYINSVAETSDGGYIVGGYFASESIDLGNGISLANAKSGYSDGMVIKYGSRGEVEWAKGIGGTSSDYINSVAETSDGGYIVGGPFASESIDLGDEISLANAKSGYSDGIVIKYGSRGEVEWAKGIGGMENDEITSVSEATDGGYIVGGYFRSGSIDLGNGVSLANAKSGYSDGMVIKYGNRGEVEWAKGIGGTSSDYINSVAETSDGGYIVGGYFDSSSIDLGDGIILTNNPYYPDGMIIKLEKIELPNPTVTQAKGIGGTNSDSISSVSETKDGGYIVGGYFGSESIDLGNGISLANANSVNSDGMVIKYGSRGEVEWAKGIGGTSNDYINSVSETKDGGYIVGGYFGSESIDLGNGISLANANSGNSDGMVIKYGSRGEVEWAKGIGGTSDDCITSVSETTDGGYIVGGYFGSSSINLGNGVSLSNNGSSGSKDGMIIKSGSSGEVEWAKGIGGMENDEITSVSETTDGGYIVGGYFRSSSIALGSGISLVNVNSGFDDGMIIKYGSSGEIEWTKEIGGEELDQIQSVAVASDGSYIVVGNYRSSSIDLGNGISLANARSSTNDGMIIKYSSSGKVEWAKGVGGTSDDGICSVSETRDGGYITGGYFRSSIDLGNGISLNNQSASRDESDGMVIKYGSSGEVEWAKGLGGTSEDNIRSVSETSDGSHIVGGEFLSSSIDLGNGISLVNASRGSYDGMILKISDQMGVPEVKELEIENKRKEFRITTDINEIDNIKGGSISGEDAKPYEKVKYGDSSTKEIKMIPDENYEIIGITVNGEDYNFTANEDGSYIMPMFTNVTEDKHIVVTYSLKDNKITINKVDKNTKEKLSGATFKLDQIEERSEPNNEEIIGELTDNGQEYTEINVGDEVTGKLGELTNNGTYYFVQNEDGTYTPTNGKTYQVANGGTVGISGSTANSYIPIDLTGLTGQYAIVVNASCSSEPGYDYGYTAITETATAPAYDSATGRFIYESGTSSAKDYTSAILEGGKIYYLHLGYRKDGSGDRNEDQIVINSIKLYNATQESNIYNFTNNDGKYESTNAGKDDTVSNSYIPIDLTNYTGKYNLTVNAEISSESSDYGYVTVTENTTRPSCSNSTGRFVYISGTQNAQDYTTVLQGGKMYYLHLGYYKNASGSSGDDKFIVNSVNISLNDSELYHTTVETNSDGQAITQIPFGKYSITETKAPDGYWLNETPTIVEFRSTDGAIHEFTIEDEAKAKLTVHHYIKGTTTKLAEDEKSEAHIGDSYTTNPKLDLAKYELETDENGKLILPENATGTYAQTPTEVTYYYVEKKIPLTVHHYIEGTSTQVPLKDGSLAEDQVASGLEGESYTSSPILDEELSEEYELAETPDNANGTYFGNEVIVTYYYKKVSRTVNLIKYQQDGKKPLQGAKFNIREKQEDIIVDKIKNNGTYYFENKDGKYVSNNQNKSNTTANSYIKIDMTNARKDATVIVNAEISSESGYDIGYATITETETAPSYDNSTGRFINISGTQSAKDYTATLQKGKVYYLHFGYRKDGSENTGKDTFTVNSIKINDVDYLGYYKTYTTNEQGKIQVNLETGTYEITEIEAPEGYKLPDNPTTEITITKSTTSEDIEITNEKKTGTVTVHYYIEGTTTPVPLADGSVAQDETKTGNVGDMYATTARTDISEGYELLEESENASGNYIDGNIEVIYYYKTIPASVVVHHYLEGTTTKLADDVTFEGIVGANYTTGVGNVDNKYEVVAIPANANGKMTRETIEVIYYYRLKNTSVLVHHYKEGTSESLSDDVIINGKVDDEYTTTVATNIPSKYELVAEPDNKNGIMTVEQTVVTYYYRLKETGVDVHYYKEGTTEKVSEDVEITGRVDDKYTTTPATDVESKYELVETPANATGTMTEDRITVIYYYRLKDTSVLVHHYLEGTTTKLADDEVINGQVDDTYRTVESTDLLFGKYDLVAEPENKTGTMTENQIVVIYYYRLKNTSVLVHHYIKDTTTSLSDDVTINGQIDDEYTTTIASDIPEYYELIAEPDNKEGIMTKEQIVVTYYYQLKNYPYVVNYLEKGTDNVLHDAKQGDELVYGSTVKSSDEKLDIDGYKFDSFDKDILTIGTANNVINIYYTKRNDLSYTVNYLEKDTNIVLHEPKVTNNMTFESVVTSSNEVIDIDGYNYDSVDKDSLTITTSENVINIYYTKRVDLSYTVNYLEKGTNRTIYAPKVTQNMTFGTEITSSKEVIAINGYSYDSVDKDSLIITTGENVINIYYTKVSGLSYTVNYLEKDTNKVLQAPKTTGDMTFEDEITSSDEVIDIDGYNYDSVDKDKLVIGTGENVINIYYTKRNDLSYKVNYLEKDTNKVLHEQKVQDNMTFEDVITSSDEVIDIDGYNYDSVDKETLTITTSENVINIYYTKRNDLSYTVNYLEKDTNKVLHEQKVQENMTFESVVNSSDEVIDIYGYNYDSVDKDTLTITTGENVINIYYTKKDAKVTVHYYEDGTTNRVSDDVEITGKVFDNYETESASDIPSKYELVAEPENKTGTMTEDEITVIYYYRKKATQVIVHYYEEGTDKKLSEDVTINGKVDDSYKTVSADDVPIKYELVAVPDNASGTMTEDTIEVIYYYRVKDAVVNVRYLEKGTDIELADADRIDGKVEDLYQTSAKDIDGYQLVEHTGNEKGKFEVEPITITYYYLYKTKATVQYIDKTTGEILEQSTTEGLEGDDFITESKDFENYVLVEEPAEKTVKMTKEEQVLKYYYIHVSGGVVEKHIDVISGQILANAVHEGNEGDEYDIPSRTFEGYDLVKDKLPENAKGTMKVDPVEVIYYYIYKTKVTAEYIDKTTGEKLVDDEVQDGHEGDNYTTERKTFDGYKLIEVPANADGTMTKENITVTYYYAHTSGGVIVNHLDVKTNKQLLDETKEEGYEGDPYETHEENISGYDLVKDKYPENAKGTMTTETIRVTYYYIKKTEVNVKYVDKETGEEIDVPTNVPGHEGDDYKTEPKDVPGYDLVEEPTNKNGTMTADPIDVIYYYRRPAKVIVNYYDADTKKKLADEVEITGHQGDSYTTEEKDIKYYKIETLPTNKDGRMIVTVTKDENGKEIVEDTTYVNYYYRKLIFNLRVDKTIASVIVNGQETAINGNLGKVEVHRKELSTANVKVVYKIKVTNDSELTGKANVVENIPSGMTMKAENNPGWTINETTASIETDEIKPGESREYQVVLGWQNGDNNIGTKENVASIVTENEAGFDEQFDTDNVSRANLIVAVGTGEVPYVAIAGGILMIMIAMTAGIYVINKKRQ